MRRKLTDLHTSGAEPIAALRPSEAAVYGRYGYRPAHPGSTPPLRQARCPLPSRNRLRRRNHPTPGTLTRERVAFRAAPRRRRLDDGIRPLPDQAGRARRRRERAMGPSSWRPPPGRRTPPCGTSSPVSTWSPGSSARGRWTSRWRTC
ncbi:hypothetical protein [Streptomyces prunicolor]|uniref:hypothetical protein n=1 Tax=Streptomyces prunicolor TaxID=67348 RepID=UPI003434E968